MTTTDLARRPAITMLGLIVVAALLAACGSEGSDPVSDPVTSKTVASQTVASQTPREIPSETATPLAPAPDGPAFADNTAPQVKQALERAQLVLTDVRVAEHGSFERIVLEFSGTGVPGWAVNYVDEAVLDGSGDVVRLNGDATLDIYASNTTWPATDYYRGPARLKAEDGGVNEVYVGGTFEGYTQVLVGIDGDPAPFRVFALANPSRLVVDVRND